MSDDQSKNIENWYSEKYEMAISLARKVEVLLTDVFLNEKIHYHAIFSRIKKLDSCVEKYSRKGYSSPNEITDLVGIRIISYVKLETEEILKRVKELFDVKETIDKSKELKKNEMGYQSIHVVCGFDSERLKLPEYQRFKSERFEIQIRTILQHAWAEIEHDRRFKFSGILPPEIDRGFTMLSGTLELADNEFDRIAKLTRVSTSKGSDLLKVIEIPRGTTRLKLQEIGSFLKRNPGKHNILVKIPSRAGGTSQMILPYKVDFTQAVQDKVQEIINSTVDDEIPF